MYMNCTFEFKFCLFIWHSRQVYVRFILLYFYIPLYYGISLLFCLSNFLPCRVLVDFVTISPCIKNFRNQTEATEKPTYERCVTWMLCVEHASKKVTSYKKTKHSFFQITLSNPQVTSFRIKLYGYINIL